VSEEYSSGVSEALGTKLFEAVPPGFPQEVPLPDGGEVVMSVKLDAGEGYLVRWAGVDLAGYIRELESGGFSLAPDYASLGAAYRSTDWLVIAAEVPTYTGETVLEITAVSESR
jgi:hypothetical protein